MAYEYYTAIDGSIHLKHADTFKRGKYFRNQEAWTEYKNIPDKKRKYTRIGKFEKRGPLGILTERMDSDILVRAILVAIRNLEKYCNDNKDSVKLEWNGDTVKIWDPDDETDMNSMKFNDSPGRPTESYLKSLPYSELRRCLNPIEKMQELAHIIVSNHKKRAASRSTEEIRKRVQGGRMAEAQARTREFNNQMSKAREEALRKQKRR